MSIFKNVAPEDWNDWRWQLRNRITSVEKLRQVMDITDEEAGEIERCLRRFRMAITPYYASLIDPGNKDCPIRQQAVPVIDELTCDKADMSDPLHEDVDSPVPGITHRYPDRVLLLVTDQCSMYCRHCTRRRMAGGHDRALPKGQIDRAIAYIHNNKEVRDVLISGGDPLTLSDDHLEYIISRLRSIKHVEIIRIGTRMPVVLPQRITPQLCNMLKKYHPLWINTHFNHPSEITSESTQACERLANAGIPLGNQSVLLRGVNDCPNLMKKLLQKLMTIRVRPYYLYQCDLSRGIGHFRTTVSKGIEIMENLRGHTTGLAVPTYVIDAPGGGGKIPLLPQYLISRSDDQVVLRNFEGNIYLYTEPAAYHKSECQCEECRKQKGKPVPGPAGLMKNREVVMKVQPAKKAAG
ncbi:lysine 2,3-aminomutase [Desulfallas thermosapovorans]|uniref:L-lysine 2,3-aminomutase n=1 Tax=Desulfallas thermosapovorans DSM 6562 TaxID=1121431 RepID=A0A5S4ZQL9_9FIRM|nr:lysine 2,3-aminomutase [Desulfallas thermosapovorans]TYO95076.1 L-lysine 2,3-aminomutase [Desulfallas thermosapovorans DSM 6562]